MEWGHILLAIVMYCSEQKVMQDGCRSERISCVVNGAAQSAKDASAVGIIDVCLANPKAFKPMPIPSPMPKPREEHK